MGISGVMKSRMKDIAAFGEKYAKSLTAKQSFPPSAAEGSPPAQRTGSLNASIKGRIYVLFGKSVMAQVEATATRAGRPYPLFLETGFTPKGMYEGAGFAGPWPWLQPTFNKMRERAREIVGRRLKGKEVSMLKKSWRKQRQSSKWKTAPRVYINL